MPNKKIIIDDNLCIGCNTCPLMAPETFELDEDTFKAKVKQQPQTITDNIKAAADSCPVAAISIVEK